MRQKKFPIPSKTDCIDKLKICCVNKDFESPFKIFVMPRNAVLSHTKIRRFMTGQEEFFLKLLLKVQLHLEIYFQCMFSAANYYKIFWKLGH